MTLEETKSQSRKPKGKRNKFGASKSGGYDSEREHRRALSLKAKLRDGLITDLREQVSFILIPVQRDAEGTSSSTTAATSPISSTATARAIQSSRIPKGSAPRNTSSRES